MANSTTFTPGPWQVEQEDDDGTPYVLHSSPKYQAAIQEANGEVVADVRRADYHTKRSLEEARANARLIAAAPEMYDAVKVALGDCEAERDRLYTSRAERSQHHIDIDTRIALYRGVLSKAGVK